jgi:hypothetical protein
VKRDGCKDFVSDPSTNNKNSVLATKGREVKQVTLKDPVVGSKQSKKNL